MRNVVLLLVLLPAFLASSAATLHQRMLWFSYNNTIAIGKHWMVHNELENRHFVGPKAENLLALRSYIRYKVGKHFDIGGGFFYYLAGTNVPEKPTRLLTPELRPMVEASNYFTWGKVTLHQRLRTEQRFIHKTANNALVSGYTFQMRVRYRLGLDVLLYETKERGHSLKLRLSDEVMAQFGKAITHFFDQNRVSISLVYQPPWPIGIEAGYLWWFQERATKGEYLSRQVFRVALLHKITLPALKIKR